MTETLKQFMEYGELLSKFVGFHRLPESWFYVPDHLALKCADSGDFEATIDEWGPMSEGLSYIHLDGRRLATAHLAEKIPLGRFGHVRWLEIMEPRPEKLGKDTVGVDHAEFFFPDFRTVTEFLGSRGIDYELQSNPNHEWVTIPLRDKGPELKLNNGTLADIVKKEQASGEAKILKS